MSRTLQTTEPLPDYRLSASNRTAREVGTTMLPMMDLDPPYQRGSVWTTDQRMALVKSWIMGVPIPSVILNDRGTAAWTQNQGGDVYSTSLPIWGVVDGKQRIETAAEWFGDKLAVPASWFPADRVDLAHDTDDGPYVSYNGLTLPGQRLMANSSLLPVVTSTLPRLEAEAELYLLVNGGGTAQTPQDMARAARVARPE